MSSGLSSSQISPGMIEHLVAYLVHNNTVLFTAARKINVERDLIFVPTRYTAAIIGVLVKYYREHFRAPDENVLECEIISIIENSSLYNNNDLTNALDLISWVYSLDADKYQKNTEYGLGLLNTFLRDITRKTLVHSVSDSFAEEANQKLPQIIAEIEQRLLDIDSIHTAPDGRITDDLWLSTKGEGFKTGLPFVDSCILTYPGDVNVILGPTGGGKTTLALQLLASSAKQDYHQNKDKCGLYIYFGYEDDISEANRKIISYTANIRRESLYNITNINQLSTTGNLLPYEEELYLSDEIPRRGERERLDIIRPFLEACIRTFNYSGARSQTQRPFGHGGIPEIRDHLEQIQQQTNKPIKMIVIDWAGMVVQRYLQKAGKVFDRNITLELESFVDRVHYEIAAPFNCIAFVVHQLKGLVAKHSPVSFVSHADAAWCSNFAVNAWNVVCIGPKDHESGAFTLSWTKTRRSQNTQHIICRMDPLFWRIVEEDRYYIDTISKRIVEKDVEVERYSRKKVVFE